MQWLGPGSNDSDYSDMVGREDRPRASLYDIGKNARLNQRESIFRHAFVLIDGRRPVWGTRYLASYNMLPMILLMPHRVS